MEPTRTWSSDFVVVALQSVSFGVAFFGYAELVLVGVGWGEGWPWAPSGVSLTSVAATWRELDFGRRLGLG